MEQLEAEIKEFTELIEKSSAKSSETEDDIIITVNKLKTKLSHLSVNLNKQYIANELKKSIEQSKAINVQNKVKGKVRVGRVAGRYEAGKKNPITYGYLNVSVISFAKDKLGVELCPFKLKDDKNRIFENIWQFSKVYEYVPAQNQKKCGWIWDKEKHVIFNEEPCIQDSYWKWRSKGMNFDNPVRYPVGFDHRHRCLFALYPEDNDYEEIENSEYPMKKLDYIEARKQIYCKLYIELVSKTEAFDKLKSMIDSGINIQLLDVDGPVKKYNDNNELIYPFNLMKEGVYGESEVGSIEITPEILTSLLNNPDHVFGHAFVLAAALLDIPLL